MKHPILLFIISCVLVNSVNAQEHTTFTPYVTPYIKLSTGYTFNHIRATKPQVFNYNTASSPRIAGAINGGVEWYFKKWLCATVGAGASVHSFEKVTNTFNVKNAYAGGQYLVATRTDTLLIRNFCMELPLGIGTNFNGFKTNMYIAPTGVFYYYDANSYSKVNYLFNGLKINAALSVEYVFSFKKIGIGAFAQQSYLITPLRLSYQQDYMLKMHPAVTSLGVTLYIK